MNAVVKPEVDLVNLEIDGEAVAVPKGSMIIQASDKIGKPIPRFCYHKKLPIAANCRMCLVEVEKSGKPMPACATPVMEGMKVFTRSEKALGSQRNVMEFLLINHPLDCPICDQGGECELQDVAMGYGRSVSRFSERKRSVADEDLGSLIATDMTRCIHCTRCVRFMRDIAGTTELGGMGRGENLEIGTWIGKSIESEIGGNIIDVCPVGALTNKVFRFKARAWELIARASVGYHDALHSNLFLHTRRGEVLRTVPRDNEAINESWLSDRDRYSHQGLLADDRLKTPLLREGHGWREASWDEALVAAVNLLRDAPLGKTGFLVGGNTSNEEGALLARIAAHVGSPNIDYRLGQVDFADDGTRAAATGFEMPLAQIENADVVVLVGCDPRREAPLLNHRLRKAVNAGAKVFAVNPVDFDSNYPLAGAAIDTPSRLPAVLGAFAASVLEASGKQAPQSLTKLLSSASPDQGDRDAARTLLDAQRAVVVVGQHALRAANAASLRALARLIADASGAAYNVLPTASNAVGLTQAGVTPAAQGDASSQLRQPLPSYLLYNAELADFSEPALAERALAAGRCVAMVAYADEAVRRVADVILPIGLLPEIDATLTNVDGVAQTVSPGSVLPGSARAGWRALRALGADLGVAGFDFVDIAGLRAGLSPRSADTTLGFVASTEGETAGDDSGIERIVSLPIYRCDAVVRRAQALQATPLSHPPAVVVNSDQARSLGLADGGRAGVLFGEDESIELPVRLDERVPSGAALIEAGHEATAAVPVAGRLQILGVA